jgi:hypothetical protein
MRRYILTTCAMTAALLLAACGGDGGSSSPTGPTDSPNDGSTRVIKENPSFAEDVQDIFERNGCTASGCHGTFAASELSLAAGSAYGEIVNVPAVSEDFLLVEPNDPQNSYIVIKVEGRHTVGSRMPLSGVPLDAIDIANLRNWIVQGAQNN